MQDHVDDFLIESPAVEFVENGVFRKDGVISKRPGFAELPAISGTPYCVLPFRGETYGITTTGVYRLEDNAWTTVSELSNPLVGVSRAATTGERAGVRNPTSVYQDGYFCVAWEEVVGVAGTSPTITTGYRIISADTNEVVVAGTISGSQPHVSGVSDDSFRILYVSGTTLYSTIVDVDGGASAPVTVQTGLQAHGEGMKKLVVIGDDYHYVIAYMNSTNDLVSKVFDAADNLVSTRTLTAASDYLPLALYKERNATNGGSYFILYYIPGSDVVFARVSVSAGTTAFSYTLNTNVDYAWCGSIVRNSPSSPYYTVVWCGEKTGGSNCDAYFSRLYVNTSSVSSELGPKLFRHTLVNTGLFVVDSQVFCGVQAGYVIPEDQNVDYALISQESATPRTHVIVRVDLTEERLYAVAAYGPQRTMVKALGGYDISGTESVNGAHTWLHTATATVDDTTVYFPTLILTSVPQTGFTDASATEPTVLARALARPDIVELEFSSDNLRITPIVRDDGVIIPAAIPLWFDGTHVSELTPIDAPLGVASNQAAAGATEAYSTVKLVCGYVDNNGAVHRSPPSAPIPLQLSLSTPATSGTYTAAISPWWDYQDGRQYFVEAYVLVDNVYKLFGSATTTTANGLVAGVSLRLAETAADPLVLLPTSGKLLYSDSELPAAAVAGVSLMGPVGSRVALIPADAPDTIFYSKLPVGSIGVEFAAALYQALPPGFRVITSAAMDDKLLLFSSSTIFVLYGQGPDNTGRGAGFGFFQLPTQLGCQDAASVVTTDAGVVFRSERGFYLIGRDLVVSPLLGAEDSLVGAEVVAAVSVPARNEIRFFLAPQGTPLDSDGPTPDSPRPPTPKYGNGYVSGRGLIYSTRTQHWSTFTGPLVKSAVVVDDKITLVTEDGDIWQETPDAYTDPTGNYYLKIITPWIKLRNLQDYGRIYKATFLGRYLSTFTEDSAGDLDAGDITIKAAYDYEKDDEQTKVWQASVELQPSLRDGETVSADRLEVVFVPKRQKCSAIRFTLEETATADADGLTYRAGRGWEIPAVDLEVGMRPGSNKSLSAQRKK